MYPRVYLLLAGLILLTAVNPSLGSDTTDGADIEQRGYWVIIDEAGTFVSRHQFFTDASTAAAGWSSQNAGKTAEIIPPRYLVKRAPIEDASPKPDKSDKPDPTEKPVEDFTKINWKNSIDLPKRATLSQVQAALNANRPVRIHAGTVYNGPLVLPHSIERLGVHGKGPRPIFNIPAGKIGLDVTGNQVQEVTIQGIELRGPDLPALANQPGIRVRLSGRTGQFVKKLLIEDCKVSRFDDCIQIVDDYARTASKKDASGKPALPGATGRITAVIRRNIITHAYGSDAHSVGIYMEGTVNSIIEQNTFDWTGWAPGKEAQRNPKGHGIYGQSYNGRLIVRYNWFSRASGNAFQLRAGGDAIGNVISHCALGPYIDMRKGLVAGNVVLDQVDVVRDPNGKITSASRGHAFILIAPDLTIKNNLAARKGGSMANMRAFESIRGSSKLENNVAIAWAPANFNIDGTKHRDIGSNRTIDKAPPKLPAYSGKLRDKMLDRPRGTWGKDYDTQGFIKACWKAVP